MALGRAQGSPWVTLEATAPSAVLSQPCKLWAGVGGRGNLRHARRPLPAALTDPYLDQGPRTPRFCGPPAVVCRTLGAWRRVGEPRGSAHGCWLILAPTLLTYTSPLPAFSHMCVRWVSNTLRVGVGGGGGRMRSGGSWPAQGWGKGHLGGVLCSCV